MAIKLWIYQNLCTFAKEKECSYLITFSSAIGVYSVKN